MLWLMQSDGLYSSLFFEHYSTIAFYSVNEWSNFAVSVWSMACQATMLSDYLGLTNLGITSALLRSSAVTSVMC